MFKLDPHGFIAHETSPQCVVKPSVGDLNLVDRKSTKRYPFQLIVGQSHELRYAALVEIQTLDVVILLMRNAGQMHRGTDGQ